MISSVHHACIPVNDMEKSIAFYRDLFGLKVVLDEELEDDNFAKATGRSGYRERIVLLQEEKVMNGMVELIEFISPKGERVSPPRAGLGDVGNIILAFETKDIEKIYKIFSEKGVKFFSAPDVVSVPKFGSAKRVILWDPDGNMIEMFQVLE